MNHEVYAWLCRQDHLTRFVKDNGFDRRDIRIISTLYYNQTARIWIVQTASSEVEIRRGVRQGCVKLHSVEIVSSALETVDDHSIGIKINGEPINHFGYY